MLLVFNWRYKPTFNALLLCSVTGRVGYLACKKRAAQIPKVQPRTTLLISIVVVIYAFQFFLIFLFLCRVLD